MKRLIFPLFLLAFFCAAFQASAQVVPSAYRQGLSIFAGGEGSAFQPDYAKKADAEGKGIASASPYWLFGIGAYVDVHFSRWVQIEAEGRWLRFNEFDNIGQDTYMIGPKVPIIEFHRWTPYGKFLLGVGSPAGNWLTGRTTTFAYGGGVEYQLSKRLSVRPFDFEYQQWQVSPTLHPYGASAGISYRVFGGRDEARGTRD